jgi:hypothetical protein
MSGNFMKYIQTGSIAVAQGSQVLFSDFVNNGPMWSGHGERETRVLVRFSDAFLTPPSVMVSLGMWDIDNTQNGRADIRAENITESEFEIVFCTWGDTRVARVRADWMAIGAVASQDEWTL